MARYKVRYDHVFDGKRKRYFDDKVSANKHIRGMLNRFPYATMYLDVAIKTGGWRHDSTHHSYKMPKRATPKQWIQSAIRKGRKGALSRQLGIPVKENIPITWLRVISRTMIGSYAYNPTTLGKGNVKVTRLLKRRAVRALTLKEWKK